ncbi:MAG: PHP domain-containing protein [Candidatus Dormibacteraceae bacterium]
MAATCRRAIELGLPAIAFTEHADFVAVHRGQHELDVAGYLEAVARCRSAFPGLRILSGVELGEPHRHPERAAAIMAGGPLDLVLASVHCLTLEGQVRDLSQPGLMTAGSAPGLMRSYLAEVLSLAASAQPFQVLAHLDYPKRYWPHDQLEYREDEFEGEYRAVLRAAAARGSVLEVNTTRGADPRRGLCPGPAVLAWWHQEGGSAVSFGSDSHEPGLIAAGFTLAAGAAQAAGFRPAADPASFWRR